MRFTYTIIILFQISILPSIAQTTASDTTIKDLSINKPKMKDTTTIKSVKIGEVVVSANRVEENKKNVAQQLLVIDKNEIENAQAQTTPDLLANSGNVFVQKSQMGGGSPVIRGFEANRILLVVDGVRMNNLIYRGGHLQNSMTLDNNSLDRVEILSGPSSTVYGSDALGGVIHFYTKRPFFADSSRKNIFKINASSRYGSVNNESTTHVDFNLGTSKFASMSSFTYSNFSDLMSGKNQNPFYDGKYPERPFYAERVNGKDTLLKNNNKYLQTPSAYQQYDMIQKFAFKQSNSIVHNLNLQFSNSSNIPRYDRLTDPSSAVNGLNSAQWYYGPQQRALAAYNLNIQNENLFFQTMHLGINYQNLEESRHNRRFKSNNLNHRIEHVQVVGLNADIQRNIAKHTLRFGIDAQYNTLKSTANIQNIQTNTTKPLDTRYPDGNNSMLNTAFYVSNSWKISEKLTLKYGARAGYVTLNATFVDTTFFKFPFKNVSQNNPVYSGSLGIVHNPSEDLKLSFLVSTGFRTPNIDDLSKIFETTKGKVIVPNANLKPEKTINAEIGVTKIINQKTSWENTFYYTHFSDAIITNKFQYAGNDFIIYDGTKSQVYANQNQQKAYIYGFTSNLKSQFNPHLFMAFTLNYTFGRIKTDSTDYPLDHISPLLSRVQFTYTNQKFSTDFFINYNGWKRLSDYNLVGEDNQQYATKDGTPAWITLNLRATYKFQKYVSIQAGIDNILDTQYRTFSSGINAPGRNMFASLRFSY